MSENKKVKLGVILDSANAEQAWREATGEPLPEIPAGCNTYTREFTADGHPALLAIQRGFAEDDPRGECNGPMVVVAEDGDAEDGIAAIREFVRRIESPVRRRGGSDHRKER